MLDDSGLKCARRQLLEAGRLSPVQDLHVVGFRLRYEEYRVAPDRHIDPHNSSAAEIP